MDKVLKVIEGVGEVGIDTEASPGNGQFYVKMYDGSYDACGFDTQEEAEAELDYIVNGDVTFDEVDDYYSDAEALASAGFGMDEDYGYASDY
jgi:hypothetical protein